MTAINLRTAELPWQAWGLSTRLFSILARWWFVPVLLVVVAAALRLPGLEGRGQFDADQGNDMMVIWRFLTAGEVPLLGPKASVGDFHQGVLYRLMLLPGAAVFGPDPVVLMTELAIMGIATVVAVWWMARSMGGPVAGGFAGLFAALSPAEIQNSTTIWCVDPIPLFAAGALGSAWRAWKGGSAQWWVVAFACCAAVAQLHLVGPLLALPVVALYALHLRRSREDRAGLARLVKGGVTGVAVAALFYVPLLVSELQTGFSETRHILEYFGTGGQGGGAGVAQLLVIGSIRVLAFPFSGPVTEAATLAAISAVVLVALSVLGVRWASGLRRSAAVWLLASVVSSIVVLAVAVPSIGTAVRGLPNDQYHFFLNPAVFTLAGLGFAAVWQRLRGAVAAGEHRPAVLRFAFVAAAVAGLAVVSLARLPAAADRDGGWPAVRSAGQRVVAAAQAGPVAVLSAPEVKMPDATTFAIVYAGGVVTGVADAPTVIVTCDRLFAALLPAPCGGPAEDRLAQAAGLDVDRLTDRFDVSSRVAISIYRR